MDVYFDTNSVSYFDAYAPEWTAPVLAKARERLIEEVDKGAINVFTSVNLIEELIGISTSDPQKYLRVIDFFWRIGQNNLLHSTEDLGRAEAKNGGPLEGNERLEWWINVDIIRRASRNLGKLAGIPQLTQQGFAKFEQDEKARRDDAKKRLVAASSETSLKTTRRWWKDAEAQVDDWVTDFMRNCQQRLGLSADPATWPKPQALQSIWRFHAYKMARIFLNVGEGRRVLGSDMYDAHHYVAASYTDLLVTDDAGFRATCEAIPNPRLVVVRFEEFVAKYLGVMKG